MSNEVLAELRNAASRSDGWLRLPPPEKGPVLWNMIRLDPWNCDFMPENDRRHLTCRLAPDDESLDPHYLNCSEGDRCAIEHANSFRTLHNIGVLPCCTSSPFCGAPPCALEGAQKKSEICTKRKAEENAAYMKDPKSWPAYHGWGGAFELDTLKFMDALACHESPCPEKLFDMVFDIGANTGYYTEKLTVRNFAKNYVLLEANPRTAAVLEQRWGQETWRHGWFTGEVPDKGAEAPQFEIITAALSNHSDGVLDMCLTEESMEDTDAGCTVPVVKVDDIIVQNLSSTFQERLKEAKSLFVKVDAEGMDELVLRGMKNLLNETRGEYADQRPQYLVNFLQFEYAPQLMSIAKEREGFQQYDLKSVTEFLESVGFESFLMGPRYLPLSHGSWHNDFKHWPEDPSNNAGTHTHYPNFDATVCWWCQTMENPSFTSDVFAIRASHPRAAELKMALGACQESRDFDLHDPQYALV